MSIRDKLNEVFQIEAEKEEIENQAKDLAIQEKKDLILASEVEADFHEAKTATREVIETASDAIEESLAIAKATEHPQAYQALSSLLTTKLKAAKTLTEITKGKIEINQTQKNNKDNGAPNTSVVQNNFFNGTTAELLEMIRGKTIEHQP